MVILTAFVIIKKIVPTNWIMTYHSSAKKETWIWNGTKASGSWLPEDELNRAKQSKVGAQDAKFKNLRINATRFEFTV